MSYKRLGDYIQRVSLKNTDGRITNLQGININKFFMPSVANTIGTNLNRYKLVSFNQFACNRMHVGRDKKLPVALSKFEDNIIVSPAYDVFEIIKENELLPDYLMMWFSREEFDRNCWFYTDTDVRGKLGWDSFCDMKLPIPSIEKQKEIVAEYNTVTNRIALNEQLNQKLEETAQTLYKHWFVDFEFPNQNGQPYKSSGGEMYYNDELDKEIPKGWEVKSLGDEVSIIRGASPRPIDKYISKSGMNWVKISDATSCVNKFLFDTKEYIIKEGISKSRIVEKETLILSNSASPGMPKIMKIKACVHDGWLIFEKYKSLTREYIYEFLIYNKQEILSNSNGSVFRNLKTDILKDFKIIVPNQYLLGKYSNNQKKIDLKMEIISIQNQKLSELVLILLGKMSKK